MRKLFLITFLSILFTAGLAFAKSDKNIMPVLKFAGTKYTLMYSAESKETGGYINEYYKAHQTYTSWTELIGVHHYPTAFYPLEHAQEFADYLNESGVPASLETDEKNNEAMMYFVVVDRHKLPIIVEFNIFKYVKSPVCGTVGLQYARRYRLNSPLEIDKAKKEILKIGLKYIKRLDKLKVPEVINLNIDNGKYSLKEGCNNEIENLN